MTQPAPADSQHQIVRLFTRVDEVQMALQQDAPLVNLLVPIGGRIDFIPPLCAISLRVIYVSADPADGECYEPLEMKGMRALGKVALSKISAAANVSFSITNRVDDGRDPHYCEVQVVATYRTFDGSWRSVPGSKAMDLREGSAQVVGRTEANVKQQRAAILRHAETKARLAALREAFSIRAHYRPDELLRPFVIPVLVFTGHTDDPEIRKLVAVRMLDMYSGSSGQLYGSGTPALPSGPSLGLPTPNPRPAPAVGGAGDDDDAAGEPQHHTQQHAAPPPPARPAAPQVSPGLGLAQQPARAAAPPAQAAPATTNGTGQTRRAAAPPPPAQASGGVAITHFAFGDWKGVAFDQLDVEALRYYHRATKASIDNPGKANFRAKNQAQLVTIEARLRQLGASP